MVFSGNVRRIATVVTANDEATGTLEDAEEAGDDTAESFTETESSARSMRRAFTATAGATTALVGVLGSLVRAHGETEQTFARMQEVAGATDDEMGEIQGTAEEIGRELPISMGQAAEAMEQLAFAGFSAEESMAAADDVANLAVASIMDMGESARTVGSLLNAFGMEAEETGRIASTMSATFSSSATNLQELSQGLERAAPVASTVGAEIEEVSAALGVMADQGVRGRRAATALRNTFRRLTDDSGPGADALRELGLSVEDVTDQEGELDDLNAVFATLGDRFDEVESQAERMRIATELAGRRGARALVPLMDNSDDLEEKLADNLRAQLKGAIGDLNELEQSQIDDVENLLGMDEGDIEPDEFAAIDLVKHLEDLHDAGESQEDIQRRIATAFDVSDEAAAALARDITDAGVSAEETAEQIGGATTSTEIAASQMDTTAGAVEFLRSSFDAMTFAIFEGAAPAIQFVNEQLARGVNALNRNEDAMRVFGSVLAIVTGALGALTAALGAKIAAALATAKVLPLLGGGLLGTAASAGTLTGALGVLVKGAIPALMASLVALAKPIAAIIAVVVLLKGAFEALMYFWDNNVMGLRSNVQELAATFSSAFDTIRNAVLVILPPLVEVGKVIAGVIGGVIVGAVAVLIELATQLVAVASVIWDVIDGLVGLIGGWSTFIEVGAVARDVFGSIANAASPVVSVLSTLWDVLAPVLRLLVGVAAAVGGVAAAFLAVANPIGAAVVAIIGAAVALNAVWDIVTGVFDAAAWGDIATDALNALVSGIRSVGDTVRDALVSAVFSPISAVLPGSDADEGPLSELTEAGLAIPRTIASGILDAQSAFINALDDVIPLPLDVLDLRNWTSAGSDIVSAIIDGFTSSQEELSNAITGALSGIMSDAMSAMEDAAKDGASAAASVVSEPLETGSDAMGSLHDSGQNAASSFADGVSSGTDEVADAAESVGSTVSDYTPWSDAKKGPLSNITESGYAFTETFASGIRDATGYMADTVSGTLGVVRDRLPFSDAEAGPLADLSESGRALVNTVASGITAESGAIARAFEDGAGVPTEELVEGVGSVGTTGQGADNGVTVDESDDVDINMNMEMNVDVGSVDDTDDLESELRRMTDDITDEALRELERRIKQDLGFNIS